MENLDQYLHTLKLPSMRASYKKEAEESLKRGDSYEAFLYRLSEEEILGRLTRQVQTLIKKAHFPSLKTLENFDFTALPSLDKKKVMDLLRGDYLEKAEKLGYDAPVEFKAGLAKELKK